MAQIGWRFPPLSGGTRQGYTNNDIESFKGQELIDNLAREICQNSLDAQLEKDSPVKVVFELRNMKTDHYDVFSQYRECLRGCRSYWRDEMDTRLSRFVASAEETLQQKDIPVLIASDYNTKGLNGSNDERLSSSWEALTGSDGVSVKSDENSAGSYGIGKNAPFACSSLSMVFYNTIDEDNRNAFIGVARLATLMNSEGKPTQRVGKYQNNDEKTETWRPIFSTDENEFRDCFMRNSRGTDVIIAGFTQVENWVTNITKAVLKNFFVAISEKKLVVVLKDPDKEHTLEADNLEQTFADLADDSEMNATAQLYKAFTSPDYRGSFEVREPDDVEVFIKSDSSYKRTIANFRATGMLVGTYYRRIFQHYAAVVVVRGQKLGELLKDTEPPRHNKWDYKQIESFDQEKRKLAKECINKIDNQVLRLLKDQFEVAPEDTVDAAGVGEYLPDDVDGISDQAQGDDILRARIKIGKVDTRHVRRNLIEQSGGQESGLEEEGGVNNTTDGSKSPFPIPHPPKPISPGGNGVIPQPGAAPGDGSKIISRPNLTAQRAFPLNASQGLYKIIVKPSETYENLYIECFAIGEDGRTEALEMESFIHNNTRINIDGGKAGPVRVGADSAGIFFVQFAKKEKMRLSLRLTEVDKQ